MCTVEKLGISGIRSFHYDRQERLSFDTPVTLIVGQNGCGKTTIIECLKMATTGLLPPNCSSGSAFIYDPRVARTAEVKGQIKLVIRKGDRQMLVSRSFACTSGLGRNFFRGSSLMSAVSSYFSSCPFLVSFSE